MAKVNKFGTFGGVFTPSILTILGVIMYLRLPMIVGEAGLWSTIGIILVAHIISFTTGLSVSSIATDKKVRAGGTYYMISRSLGLPFGGTLGLALFVGLSFSVSLYLIGFSESFLAYWNFDQSINAVRVAGTVVLLFVTIITLISTSLAIKTQYVIMAAIVLSLVSIFIGNSDTIAPAAVSLTPSVTGSASFMLLLGIFFPAVTGFEAGVSMSGDLKDPKKSIPQGSIIAIAIGFIVYVGLAVYLYFNVNADMLANDPQVLLNISWKSELVIAGVWGATLSSALGSILGAPRILQATALDKITPRFFSRGVGESNEPRNALLLTFLIAEIGILIGDLDIIARVVSIFFITTYGFLNLSCAFERWTSVDFRPTFKTPIWISLLGAVACFIVMIELDFIAAISATAILFGLYLFLKRRELSLQTGDTWSGVWSSLAKTALQRLTKSKQHNRNWRPNILLFNGADKARPFMTKLGNSIAGKLGLLSSFELVISKDPSIAKLETNAEPSNTENYFQYTYPAEDAYSGIDEIARVYGFAGVQPNTVLMGWSKKPENKKRFLELIASLQQYNLNSLFLHHASTETEVSKPTIDIWWSGWGRNLSLALNILRHLTLSESWSRASIRLIVVANDPDDEERIKRYIKNILDEYRTQASIKIIDQHVAQLNKQDIISAESAATTLTIVGIPDAYYDDLDAIYGFANEVSDRINSVIFINAAPSFEEYNVFPTATDTLSLPQNEWILPELIATAYPEINEDVYKIDLHNQQLVASLNKKLFAPSFSIEQNTIQKLVTLAESTSASVEKALRHEQPYQRTTAMMRLKRYFLAQVQQLLQEVLTRSIEEKEASLTAGINWYLELLENEGDQFPKFKTIQYRKEEFKSNKADDVSLRVLKITKKILHPFAKKTIGLRITYREGAIYFFRDTRYHFLSVLLRDLLQTIGTLHDSIYQFIAWTDKSFQLTIEAQGTAQGGQLGQVLVIQLKEKSLALQQQVTEAQSLFKGRLQVESRKNTLLFAHHLERINFNQEIKRRKRSTNFYNDKISYAKNFPEQWLTLTTLDYDTIKANALLHEFYGQVHQEVQAYIAKINQFFDQEVLLPIRKLVDTLNHFLEHTHEGENKKQPTLPNWNFNFEYVTDALRESRDQLLATANTLPEELIVKKHHQKEAEGMELPLRTMVAHLTETKLTSPISDTLEVALEKIKRTNLVISDHASLAMFNVFNLKDAEDESVRLQEIKAAIDFIEKELDGLKNRIASIDKDIEKHASELKNVLKVSSLTEMSGDLSQQVRSQRTKKLQTKLSGKLTSLTEKISNFSVSVLYSQTKGILLARSLSSTHLSVNERLIKTVARTTPNHSLLLELPHYYVSLFSGRSSIGDSFWVPRPAEEQAFETAYLRYKNGHEGMILVLGERNAGKTALCKRFAERNSDTANVYHIFPPEGGALSIEDFQNILRKVTKYEGNSAQVFNLLSHATIVVIHDLELWWERSANGLTVIQHIKSLIDEFSSKCLFIVNMNTYSFPVINTAEPLDFLCSGVVRCQPFNSIELKQLIMTRHKSSGLDIDLGARETGFLSELKRARIFNKLFTYSKGTPGVAMNAWLIGIKDFEDKTIKWSPPPLPDSAVFTEMPELWNHICLQLLLHKRMTTAKIMRVIPPDDELIVETLQAMRRLQLISVRGESIYFLNPNTEFLLVDHFKEKEWI